MKVLSTVFRAKFLEALEKNHDGLVFPEKIQNLARPNDFKNLLGVVSQKNWVVFAKKPFAGPEQVIQYLGQYTHRVAISNHRLIEVEDGRVLFQYRDYRDQNKSKRMALSLKEFMRRFLLHVLPPKFTRIRHYGFLASRLKQEKLARLRALLTPDTPLQPKPSSPDDWKTMLLNLTGIDVNRCPLCSGPMLEIQLGPWHRPTHFVLLATPLNTS